MYAGWNLQELATQFPEVSRYTRVGPSVPVLPVTSQELATATYNAFTQIETTGTNILKYDIVGQANSAPKLLMSVARQFVAERALLDRVIYSHD